MKQRNKSKILYLVFLPLLLSLLSTFLVYSGHFSNYYKHYDNLLTTSFPDYSIIIRNNSLLLDSDLNMNSFLNQFNLEEVTYIGYLQCELHLNSSIYNIVLFWAPEDYYIKHSNIGIEKGTILLDESFLLEDKIELNQNLTLEFSFENNETETSILVGSFVTVEDILTSDLLMQSWDRTPFEKYLFVLSETFKNIFEEFIENLNISYVYLFEFSEAFLRSYPPHQMVRYLDKKRQDIDYHFDYTYNSSNSEERRMRQYSLEGRLIYFTENYKEYTFARVFIFYVICFGFCYIVINNTSRTFVKSQKEKIEFYYLRGSKRSKLILDFIRRELGVTLLTIFFGFLISIFIMKIFTPSLLVFGYYHGMNIVIISSMTVLYSSIQLLVSLNDLSLIYKRGENERSDFLHRIFAFFKSVLPWLMVSFVLAVSLFLFLFTGIEKFELSARISILIFGLTPVLLLVFMMSKKTIIWIGEKLVFLLSKISKIGKYSLKTSKRIIKTNSRIIQLLILFGFICSFFVTGVDTINHYNYINQSYNQVGDIIISYPGESPAEKVGIIESQFKDYIDFFDEIQYLASSMDFEKEQNHFFTYSVRVFLLNSSTISRIFNSDVVTERYVGSYKVQQISEELMEGGNLSIVNKAFADLTKIQPGDPIIVPLPIKDKYGFYPTEPYNTTVLDIADFIPFFSGIARENPLVIFNSNIEANKSKLDIMTIYQMLWLKDNVSTQVFIEKIQTINENYDLHIEIVTQNENLILTDQYWVPSILQTLIISLFTVLTICLIFFLFGYYLEIIFEQIRNFRTFFARGLSIKKGIILSILPILVFTFCYITIGYVIGIFLLTVVIASIQPEYYLKIPLSVYPYSVTFFIAQIIMLISVLLIVGFISYKKLQKHIPAIEYSAFSIMQEEEDFS